MRRTLMNRRFRVIGALAMLVMTLVYAGSQIAAADELLKWLKLDTMDTNFSIVENKAGDQEVLLALDVEDAGTYNLYYYLEDGRQTFIQFEQAYEYLNVEYHIRENDGAGGFTDITQSETSLSYLEMDYELTVPDWEYDGSKLVGDSGGLEYSILRSASSKYPGVSFQVNNKQVLIKWDFQTDKIYMVIDDYENGKIMPILYETPKKGNAGIKVLKQLEDLAVTPTHYITTDGAFNVQLSPLEQPNDDGERPGGKPGFDVTFKQPMEMDGATWTYDYGLTDMDDITAIFELADIGTDAYFDFKLKLQDDPDMTIGDIDVEGGTINDDVVYLYDTVTHEYTVHILKDKSTLAQQETLVQWSELAASRLYEVNVGLQVEIGSDNYDDYEFTTYQPEEKFAATYMAYELKRSSVEEAYLDVTPFNAGSQEEIEYTVLYSKVIKESLDIDEDLWLKNYHTTENENDEIFIPVPFRSTSSQDAYQIVVSFAGSDIYSQVLNYRAIDDSDVPPTTPSIDLLENLFVVPPLTEGETDPEKIQFDLVWTAPTNKGIQELDTIFEDLNATDDDFLYYELSVNDVPTDKTDNPFQVVKVFEVTKVGESYEIGLFSPVTGDEEGSNVVNFINGYNETDEQFRVDQVTFRENGAWTNVLTTVIDDDNDLYTVTDSGNPSEVEFPGVNYIRIMAISMKDGELSTSSMSIPESLSLSLNYYAIPMVDTLTYEPLYGVEEERTSGIILDWNQVDIENYESYMLSPVNKSIDDVIYTLYLAEENASVLPLDEDESDYEKIIPEGTHEITIDNDEISLLRDGKVLYFDVYDSGADDYNIEIEGLDANRHYYVRIVTKLDINDETDHRRSDPSNVLSVTVPKTPDEPGDEEIFPLAPELFGAVFADESLINALLTWTMPEEMNFDADKNGFEIVAIEDRSLPEALKGNTTALRDIFEAEELEGDVVEGWRLYVYDGETVFEKYDLDTNTYVAKNMNLVSLEDNVFTMIDDANAPNKVNYYYVRTVKMAGTTSKTASPWANDALTTSPVKGPINLLVDYTSAYTFEGQSEFIVRFDAPIPNVESIGDEYVMEIHLKGEDDTDYSITKYPSTYLGTNDLGPAGYKRLFYKISDLAPGKTYTIKARIQDRNQAQETLPDGSKEYPRSPFTDLVVSRTEFDQEAYDKENKYFEYLDYYLEKAEELKELLYFKITNTSNETALKYRENYSEGLIQLKNNRDLTLYSENKAVNTYYIPSNTLALINDQDVTLVINSKNQLVGIRPDTIGVRITDEVNEMIDSIERYTSTNNDYYLRIKVFTDDYNGTVNGADPEGPLVEVQFAIVGAKKLEEDMDELMVAQLDSVIQSNRFKVINNLELELEKGINDRELLSVVEAVVDEVEAEYVGLASILFKGYLDDDVTSINEINQSIYIALQPDDGGSSHGVHTKLNGSWSYVSSNYFNDRYYVESKTLDPYITVASSQIQDDLKDLYGQQAVDVINAYELTTVFSSYDLSKPEELLDKYQWVSAVARVVGARAEEDNVGYLENKGIEVTGLNLYSSLSFDEALVTYLDAYAYKHNIDMAHVYVSDYGVIEDIEAAAEVYRLPLIRGANIGIIQTDGGMLYPSHSIDMKEALTYLTTLHNGLD